MTMNPRFEPRRLPAEALGAAAHGSMIGMIVIIPEARP